ncbi:MAG: efflux RND transporter periplasmic adaptor subunit [Blastocatellia bacterium]|nr:efflux RND transporter periplasmic adaptor subunit [Blastocatellia bacterium]
MSQRNWKHKPLRWRVSVVLGGILVLTAIPLIALKIFGPGGGESGDLNNETVVVSVHTVKAEKQPIAAQISAIGNIFPKTQATISAKLSGQITHLDLLKNRTVQQGDRLLSIEARDVQSQREEAQAALEEARLTLQGLTKGGIPQTAEQNEKALRDARANLVTARTLVERRKELAAKGGIAQKDLEAAQLSLTLAENDLRLAERTVALRSEALTPNDKALAEIHIKQAEKKLATLETQLGYAEVLAPFSGVVTEQFQFQGEFATSGGKLLTLADAREVIVKVPFADTVAAQLKVGNPAVVEPLDRSGTNLEGKISLISQDSDLQSRTVEVWVTLKNDAGQLRLGSAAKVTVTTTQAQEAIVVPLSAVTLRATNQNEGTVMVVDNQSIAHETKVTVGIHTLEKCQITTGLQGGETVVSEGNYSLPDGTKVQSETLPAPTTGKPEPAEKEEKP